MSVVHHQNWSVFIPKRLKKRLSMQFSTAYTLPYSQTFSVSICSETTPRYSVLSAFSALAIVTIIHFSFSLFRRGSSIAEKNAFRHFRSLLQRFRTALGRAAKRASAAHNGRQTVKILSPDVLRNDFSGKNAVV